MIPRRPASLLAGVVLAAAVAGLLSGCEGSPENGQKWLAGQSGIVSTSIVSETREELSTSGVVSGELRKGISADDLQKLVDTVGAYQSQHRNVTFELGQHDIDFAISDRATNAREIRLWRTAVKTPKAISGLVSSDGSKEKVALYTLRPDAVRALVWIGRRKADLQISAYRSRHDAENGATDDKVLRFSVPRDCHPADGDWAFAQSVPSRADVPGGMLDLCTSLQLDGAEDAPLAAMAAPLRADLEKSGVTLPTTLVASVLQPSWARTIAVLPGDAAAFPVLAAIQPSPARYKLEADGTLTITDHDHPVDQLIAAVTAAPGASTLPEIDLFGSDVAVGGPLAALTGLRTTALALDAASDTFDEVALSPTYGSVQLDGTISVSPDVKTAASVLKTSGITQGRTFSVGYISMTVDIVDGVAKVHDTYSDSHAYVLTDFAAAWNALG